MISVHMREDAMAVSQHGTCPDCVFVPALVRCASDNGQTAPLLMAVLVLSLHSASSKSVQMHSIKPDEDSFSMPIGFSMAAPALRSTSGSGATASALQSSSTATASTSSSDRPAGAVLHHFKKYTTPTTYSPSTTSTSSTTPTIVYAGSYSQRKYSQPQAQYQPKEDNQYHSTQQSQYQSQSSQQNQYETQQTLRQPYYQSDESQYKSHQSQTQPEYQLKTESSQYQPQQTQYQAQQYTYQSHNKNPQTQQQNEVFNEDDETFVPSATTQRASSQYYQQKTATYTDPQSPQDEQSLFQKQHSYQKLQKYQNQNQQSYHNTMSVYNAQQNDNQAFQTLQQSYQQKPMNYHNYAGSSTPVANAVSIEEAVAAAAAVTQRPTTASYERYYEAIAATATTPAPRDTSPRYQYWKRKSPHGYQHYKPYAPDHAMSSYSRVVPPPAYRRVAPHRGPHVQHYYHGPYTMEAALPMTSTSSSDHSSHSWLDHALSPVKREDSLLSSIGAPAGSSTALLNGLLVPIVLLGLSIPALGFAYTYLNRRRDFGGGFSSYLQELRPNEETVNQYLRFLQTAIECYQDPKKHNC